MLSELASEAKIKKTKKQAPKQQIRGSSLLLVGRFVSRGVNFLVQVLIVRYLTQADYGAFAYALSLVTFSQTIATFGLDRAVTRFIPIYHEQEEYDKLFGTLFMVVGSILSLGIAIVLFVQGFQGLLAREFISDQQALGLLMVLIVLAPVQAIDNLLLGLFSVFASPKVIFFRKNILGPALKLLVVLALILFHGDASFLAVGYLVAGILGVTAYIAMLVPLMRKMGLFGHFDRRRIVVPWKEILAFTVPLLTSDLVYIVMNTVDAVMLEHFQGTIDVAALRAVQPTAKMNQIVLASFGILFTPLAARMFARNDRQGINNLYWQNAIWIAVISFPVFALTFSLAKPITVFLYGERYAGSAIILALLSFAYYFNAALGQNGLTLKVFGKVRYIVAINVFAAVANFVANLLLIPRYGALGAAMGTCGSLVLHNILKQAGLRFGTGINLFEWQYLRVYLIIAASALSLFLIQWLTGASVYVSIGLAALASLVVFRLNRRLLRVGETFPELLKLPLMDKILGD